MVREEILRRQLLAAEDRLIAALKHGGLEEFMLQWASLQRSISVGAEQGQLSDELLILNDSVCQGVADIVQSCLAVEDGINQAFNANDIPSDFTLSNEGQDALAESDFLRVSVTNDDGVSSPIQTESGPQFEPDGGSISFQQRSLLQEEGDSDEYEHDSDSFSDQDAWEEEDWGSDEEELDEPDPDWDKMQDWFLANIAYPFLDPHDEDPIIQAAPISPDHLEMWVSEICEMCNWQEVYSLYAFNDRVRMEMLCGITFGLKSSQRTTGSLIIPKEIQDALWSMRESAISACNYLQQSRANITVDLERMAYMLSQLPVGAGIKGEEDPEEWSAADSDAWAAEIVNQYNQLVLSPDHSLETQENQNYKCKSEPASETWESKLGPDTGEPKLPHPLDQEGTVVKNHSEDEQQDIFRGIPATPTVPATRVAITGTKRKLEDFLAQSNMDDPQHAVALSLSFIPQRDTRDLAEQYAQEEVSTDSHRSKRKRSNSPSHRIYAGVRSPSEDHPEGPILAVSHPAFLGASSPSSRSSSSSGSDSGSPYYLSPPADQNSPNYIPPESSPVPSRHTLAGHDPVELDYVTSSSQVSRVVDAPNAATAASSSITPAAPCLLISSNNNNTTAYSPNTHSPYSQHSTPKSIHYSDFSNNPTLFKNNDPGHQRDVAIDAEITTPINPAQAQVSLPEVDAQKEPPSRPEREQIPIERKRTRAEYEVEPDCTGQGSPSPSSTPLSCLRSEDICSSKSQYGSLRYYKPRGARRNNLPLSSHCQLPLNLGGAISHQFRVEFKMSLAYPRADLDKHDIRPTKRAYLAPRDYSLSPDT